MARSVIDQLLVVGVVGCLLAAACSKSPDDSMELSSIEASRSTAAATPTQNVSSREVGQPLIQRYITSSKDNRILGDLCLITENAVTVTRSVYNIQSAKNSVRTRQRFMNLQSDLLRDSIANAIVAPKIIDDHARSPDNSVSIFLFDHQKDADNPAFHVLFNHSNSGIEKKDSVEAAALIATTNELCSAALR